MLRRTSALLAGAAAAIAMIVLPVSPATAATGAITGLAGKCVDVAGANSANGTAVQLYDCNGTGAQNWNVVGNGQRASHPHRPPGGDLKNRRRARLRRTRPCQR